MKKTGKMRIYDALCVLAAERAVDKVSVSSLISEAGINRSSFYYHFDSTQAVLDSMIDDFSEQYLDLVWRLPKQAESGHEHWVEAERDICRFVGLQKRYIYFFLSDRNYSVFKRKFLTHFYQRCSQYRVVQLCPDGETRPLKQGIAYDYYLRVCAYQLLGILELWAERGFSEEAEDFVQILGILYSCRILPP